MATPNYADPPKFPTVRQMHLTDFITHCGTNIQLFVLD